MDREEARNHILNVDSPHILCELPTSFGKTKIALELLDSRIKEVVNPKILLVIPRLVLIDNWKEEVRKWGMEKYLPYIKFVTYISFPKKADEWDVVIFDEVHHLSSKCMEALDNFTIHNTIMLSATVKEDMKKELESLFPDLYKLKVSTREAIDEEVLPDPKVYLLPLRLDSKTPCYKFIKNPSQKVELRIDYVDKRKYIGIKNRKIVINCTQKQYYEEMSSLIKWYGKKKSKAFKNLFLRKSGERLKWLSEQKSVYVKLILKLLTGYRTLTFCNGIKQTEELGRYCINSSNDQSEEYLQLFNSEKISHITACNMLDEGVNLVNCRVGIYAVLNSSKRIIVQKLGRLLRHPEPLIIIPYFKNTREEEIVDDMMEDYNPELVIEVEDINELKEALKHERYFEKTK